MSELAEPSLSNSEVRSKFPLLNKDNDDIAYLDTAATSQKPDCVIDAVADYYTNHNANVHRGVYPLSHEATVRYEACRQEVRGFINAGSNDEIVFTKGTTDAMNLLSSCFARGVLQEGDEVLISAMEHHSSIVPWQLACASVGAKLVIIPLNANFELDLDAYANLLNEKTKVVSLVHVSNVLGTINPIKSMVTIAHAKDIPVVVDGAQAAAHIPIDVQDLDCDFYMFSSHKTYGPTGVGVMYGKKCWLDRLPPYQYGGDMIKTVSFEKTTFNDVPYKFEAGTPNIAGVVGFGEALGFINAVTLPSIQSHEDELLSYATSRMASIPGIVIHGSLTPKIGIVSFTMAQAHPHDVATILADCGVAVRAGHHCAMPLIKLLGVSATVRISFGIYNNFDDVDRFLLGLQKVVDIFGGV
jgi:cysteine desulfurase / selenocysteine lyase